MAGKKKSAKEVNTKTTKKPKVEENSPIDFLYQDVLDEIEKALKVTQVGFSSARLSTGILSVDIALGGGLSYGGMVSLSGMEGSAKSTLLAHIMAQCLKDKVGIIDVDDAENAIDNDYTSSIFHVTDLTKVFGKRTQDGKGWEILPKARYTTNDIVEDLFDRMVMQLNRIPDKVYRPEKDKWYFVINNTDKKLAPFAKSLGKPDPKLSGGGKSYYPTDNDKLQAVFFVDSWPSFTTEAEDENEDSSKAMALMARAFSKHLPRVRGKLRKKCAMIIGVNQLRERPGVMFGSPVYEPCGQALKFNSSCRNELGARAVPAEWRHDSKESKFSEEPSVQGKGVDQYQYKFFKNTKNKNGTPFGSCWFRVWIKDFTGKGKGIDPVWDVAQYLYKTKLAYRFSSKDYGKNAIEFYENNVSELSKFPLAGCALSWLEFKILILAETHPTKKLKEQRDEILKEQEVSTKFRLYKWCKDSIPSGLCSKMISASNEVAEMEEDEEDMEE